MKKISDILHFTKMEFVQEFRLKYAFTSILLYVLSTIYLIYFSLEYQDAKADLLPVIWAIFFWIVVLFTVVNATYRSFSKESAGKQLFYFNLMSPVTYILAKMLSNAVLVSVMALLTSFIYQIVLGNPIQHLITFYSILFIGTLGYTFLFTFISALSARANAGAVLSVVLGFPLSIPLLTMVIKLFNDSFSSQLGINFDNQLIIAIAFNFIPLLLALILFPYIWRE